MKQDATAPRATDPMFFDIESVFDAAKALNRATDAARLAGWSVDVCGADYVSVEVKRVQPGDAQ